MLQRIFKKPWNCRLCLLLELSGNSGQNQGSTVYEKEKKVPKWQNIQLLGEVIVSLKMQIKYLKILLCSKLTSDMTEGRQFPPVPWIESVNSNF